MYGSRTLGTLLVAVTLLAGCATLDDDWQRDRRRTNPNCGVDVRYWENRVEQFKDRRFKNPDKFRQAKADLVKALKAADTSKCGKRVRREMDQLVSEVLVVQQ